MDILKDWWSIILSVLGFALVVIKWFISYEKSKALQESKDKAQERERELMAKTIDERISQFHIDAVNRETEIKQTLLLEVERTKNEIGTKLHNTEVRFNEKYEKIDNKLNEVGKEVSRAVSMLEVQAKTSDGVLSKLEKNDEKFFEMFKLLNSNHKD